MEIIKEINECDNIIEIDSSTNKWQTISTNFENISDINYENNANINWEQRRYEISKSIFASCIEKYWKDVEWSRDEKNIQGYVDETVELADRLIEKLIRTNKSH